jgi:transposase-like protein
MRHSKELILKVIKRHYEFGMSFRDISKNIHDEYGIKISYVTAFMWCRKFALLFKQRTENTNIKLSKTWHIDETVIKIRGKKHWIFAIIDRKTRFVIAWYLSKTRTTDAAIKTINLAIARAGFKPNRLVSDRHPIYQEINKLKPKLAKKSVLVGKFSDKLSNNRIERYFNTFKPYYKRARGLKSFFPVTCFLTMHVVYYNFFRSHSALNNQSPAEAAGFKSVLPDRWCSVFSS